MFLNFASLSTFFNSFLCLMHFLTFHILNFLPNSVMCFLSNSFMNLNIPPPSFFMTVYFPFQLTKHLFCSRLDTINHLISHHRSFSPQIPFSPLYLFIFKYCCALSFQIPTSCFRTLFIYF